MNASVYAACAARYGSDPNSRPFSTNRTSPLTETLQPAHFLAGAFQLQHNLSKPQARHPVPPLLVRVAGSHKYPYTAAPPPRPRPTARASKHNHISTFPKWAKGATRARPLSFLGDNDGPNTMLSHASTSADQSMARRRAEAARKIDDIMSNLNG
ncbi:hypothetical protein CTAM01_02422 [Colletotrichum tamarilloi]|uniref:Developmental regulatory protein wetA n=1 Tax=Colletotrichum tamarilloi TaxID=1209934 RepID=A0ABQ9RPH4_9PEZI|nr:uncharacterized protein CTAM01_02422 [Colletotrichum tamarilloi]KAK1508636.1 hypothetical protein CTAM01_02422 [Colletotrichum tamarilloi]